MLTLTLDTTIGGIPTACVNRFVEAHLTPLSFLRCRNITLVLLDNLYQLSVHALASFVVVVAPGIFFVDVLKLYLIILN